MWPSVTVVTKTGLTAAGAGGSLQPTSRKLRSARVVSDTAGKILFTGASLRQERSHGSAGLGLGEPTAQRLVELHVGQHLLQAAVRQGEFAGQHGSLHVQQHQQVDLPFTLQRLRALQRAAAVVDGAGQRSGALGLLGAHEQAVLDLLHGDQHRLLPLQTAPRSARADCARMPASMRPALKIGMAKASATFEKRTGERSSAFSCRSSLPSRTLRKSLGHRWACASAPRSVSAPTRASAAIRSGRRRSSSLGWPVPISRAAGQAKPAFPPTTPSRRVAAQQHGQPRLRDAGQHPQRRHLRVECVGLGARAVQVEGAGLAFAQAAGHADRRFALRRGEGLHDAQTLLGATQHEVLPRHLAGHQQPCAFHTGRCGRRIGLRRVARRAHAAGHVDLPGHVDPGAQRTYVRHDHLDRRGQPAFAARGGSLHAHRGPQAGTLGIAARASLGDALQGDGHVLVGGQGLLDQRRQGRVAVAGPPGAVEGLSSHRSRPSLRKGGGQRHRRHRGLYRRHRAGRQDGQRRERQPDGCAGHRGLGCDAERAS